MPYVENIFLFSNKRLLKDNILVKQKINNKRLFSSSLKKDNMSSNCLSSMLSTVIPLKWGHVSGIECLQYLEYNIYTQLILYSMLQKSLVASSHQNKLYTEMHLQILTLVKWVWILPLKFQHRPQNIVELPFYPLMIINVTKFLIHGV